MKLPGAESVGDITGTHRLWQTDLLKDSVGSGVVAAGCVFLPTQFGSLVCLDLKTGKKNWEKRLAGEGTLNGSWSSLVLVGDQLLFGNQSGEVFRLRASPKYEKIALHTLGDETMCASPAVAGNQIFLRTYKALWCVGE
jgi:outer membrane protein assembly factor BamB